MLPTHPYTLAPASFYTGVATSSNLLRLATLASSSSPSTLPALPFSPPPMTGEMEWVLVGRCPCRRFSLRLGVIGDNMGATGVIVRCTVVGTGTRMGTGAGTSSTTSLLASAPCRLGSCMTSSDSGGWMDVIGVGSATWNKPVLWDLARLT